MPKKYSAYPAMVIDSKKKYTARITTTKGVIDVELFAADWLLFGPKRAFSVSNRPGRA